MIPIEINDHQEIGFGCFCKRPKIPEAISGHESALRYFETLKRKAFDFNIDPFLFRYSHFI